MCQLPSTSWLCSPPLCNHGALFHSQKCPSLDAIIGVLERAENPGLPGGYLKNSCCICLMMGSWGVVLEELVLIT